MVSFVACDENRVVKPHGIAVDILNNPFASPRSNMTVRVGAFLP